MHEINTHDPEFCGCSGSVLLTSVAYPNTSVGWTVSIVLCTKDDANLTN